MSNTLHDRAKALEDEFGYWEEHPDHSLDDWRESVILDGTRMSYWEWVADKIENAS